MNNLNKTNKLFLIAIFLLVLLAIPLTIMQVQNQQEIRQRAAPLAKVSPRLELVPIEPTVIEKFKSLLSFSLDIHIKNNSKRDISALTMEIIYEPNDLEKPLLIEPKFPRFEEIQRVYSDSDDGDSISLTLVNTNKDPINDPDIVLYTISFTAKKGIQSTTVSLKNIQITIAGEPEKIKVEDFNLSYQIVPPTLTPNPTRTPTPLPPTLTLTPTPPCPTAKNYFKIYEGLSKCYGKKSSEQIEDINCGDFDYNNNKEIDGIDYNQLVRFNRQECTSIYITNDLSPNFMCFKNTYTQGQCGNDAKILSTELHGYFLKDVSEKECGGNNTKISCAPVPEELKPPQPPN